MAMDSLLQLNLSQTSLLSLIGGTFFTAVFLLVLAISRIMRVRSEVHRRAFHQFSASSSWGATIEDPCAERRSLRHQAFKESTAVLLAAASKFVPSDKASRATRRRDLVRSGFFDPAALYWFYAARLLLGVALPLIFLLAVELSSLPMSIAGLLGGAAALGVIGLLLPSFYLVKRQKRLKQQARNGFPDFMDVMVVCVEAGLSLPAAIDRVGRELAQPYPHLGANLHLVSLELRAGQRLPESLENLSDRLGIDDVGPLAVLLRQSEELGTSLAEALRVYSMEMRDKRLSRAEEKAHALPVKLVLPLGLSVFPVMLIFIMLPLIIRIKNAFL
jgi:tight adherence protein C